MEEDEVVEERKRKERKGKEKGEERRGKGNIRKDMKGH